MNAHIREVADRFAAGGYRAIAPAYFDRVERGVNFDYTPDNVVEGRALRGRLTWEAVIADTDAALAALDAAKAGLVGYCLGGTIAWIAADACRLDVAVGYYGGQIPDEMARRPKCPIMLHFGADDAAIPLDGVDAVRTAHPDVPIHVYEGAGHGFNCDRRSSYHAEAARLAGERTHAFLAQHLG